MKLSVPLLSCLVLLAAVGRSSGQNPTPASAANGATATQFPATPAAAPAAGAPASPPLFTPVTPSPAATVALPTLPSPAAAAAASPSPAAAPEAQAQEPTPGPSGTYTLNPFSAIVACVPFNFLVSPSTDDKTYSVSSSVNAAVQAAVRLTVEDKTLYLGFNHSFESPDAIRINISLPAGQLQRVSNKGMGDIILNSGFKPASAVLAVQGTGRVLARGLDTQNLEVQSSGSADVFAKGAIGTANVTMSGTGRVTLAGVTKSVTAQLDGISSLFVDAASDDVSISAKPSGISKVYYTRGKCDAGQQLSLDVPFFSMDLGLSACVKVQGSAFPRYKAAWSCGMKATGATVCTPGATQQAATAAQGADISVQSVTPDSSGTAASSSSLSSSSSSATVSASSPSAASGNARAQAATVSLLQGPATPEEEAADIGVTANAGHRRLLKTLLLPPLLPLPSLHHHGMFHQPLTTTTVASSSSSDDGNGNTVSVTVGGNGGVSMTVGSVTCSAKQEDLYIAGK